MSFGVPKFLDWWLGDLVAFLFVIFQEILYMKI